MHFTTDRTAHTTVFLNSLTMSQDGDYYANFQATGGTEYVNVEIRKSDCNANDTDNYLEQIVDPDMHLVDTTSSEPVPGTMRYPQKQPQRNMKTLSKDSAYSTSSGETETGDTRCVSDCKENDMDDYLEPIADPHVNIVDTTSGEPVPGTMRYPSSGMQKQPQRNMKTLSKDSGYSTSSGDISPEICFDVYVEPFVCKKTPPTFGPSVLAVNGVSLELRSKDNGTTYLTWPIVFIRRYGATEQIFHLEAGRRSESGEGLFNFFTPYGKLIIEEIKKRSAH
ncbi:uncharacterized protein LOC121380363 [Gigantopelta aegis]|uniref:uncharacterized protein LOC121380363 n=1 Tax=Gigantopelta aegis TaxID=1735272 RepID=UPI001B88D67E|nr:uncharacterized protein LOC121380363 [Gigantopelta aegis]